MREASEPAALRGAAAVRAAAFHAYPAGRSTYAQQSHQKMLLHEASDLRGENPLSSLGTCGLRCIAAGGARVEPPACPLNTRGALRALWNRH